MQLYFFSFFFYLFNANKLQQRYYSIKWTKSEVDSVEWNSLKSVMILSVRAAPQFAKRLIFLDIKSAWHVFICLPFYSF